ncbi:MAG: NTP transferase domain-containing protein [bacterium]|nr:NTP transferase domain-containing protein [bacterium]
MSRMLVILAAGLGRRYGGLKQIESVGPSGETILEYSIHDAIRAEFTSVVFVTRRDIEDDLRRAVGRRIEERVHVRYAHQELNSAIGDQSLPPCRTKPWGTGQAVLAAGDFVTGPFAVVNADDFYGPSSWTLLAEQMSAQLDPESGEHSLVGFGLERTLSAAGVVSRGVCQCTDDGYLSEVTERTRIERVGGTVQYVDDDGHAWPLAPDAMVSMNMWGFGETILSQLEELFTRFVADNPTNLDAEFALPTAVNEMIGTGRARVKVVPTTDTWCGITYPEDKPRVSEHIRMLVDRGAYPRILWT